MPEEEKVQEEQEQEETPKAKFKLKGPLLLGIIGVVAFVVAVGGFSVMMGVFSSPPSTENETEAADTAQAKAGTEVHDGVDQSEMDALEAEMFGLDGVGDAEDIDDLMKLAEREQAGLSEEDSIAAVHWLEAEKTKLAGQRAELDSVQKEFSRQEYRLKQLIAKTNQMESTRINALAKLYDGMKPAQVAPLIKKLSESQAVEILLKMKPANAAKILGALSPDYAARISARMITLTEE